MRWRYSWKFLSINLWISILINLVCLRHFETHFFAYSIRVVLIPSPPKLSIKKIGIFCDQKIGVKPILRCMHTIVWKSKTVRILYAKTAWSSGICICIEMKLFASQNEKKKNADFFFVACCGFLAQFSCRCCCGCFLDLVSSAIAWFKENIHKYARGMFYLLWVKSHAVQLHAIWTSHKIYVRSLKWPVKCSCAV